MVDPITALLVVGTVVSAVGAVRQGQAAKQQADAQAAANIQQAKLQTTANVVQAETQAAADVQQAETQALVLRQQAAQERVTALESEDDFRREQSRLTARRRAILGGSGVAIGSGSPLLVSEDFASEIELQALRLRAGGDLAATRLEQQAELGVFGATRQGVVTVAGAKRQGVLTRGGARSQAALTRAAGSEAATAGVIRGGATLAGGLGKTFGRPSTG